MAVVGAGLLFRRASEKDSLSTSRQHVLSVRSILSGTLRIISYLLNYYSTSNGLHEVYILLSLVCSVLLKPAFLTEEDVYEDATDLCVHDDCRRSDVILRRTILG